MFGDLGFVLEPCGVCDLGAEAPSRIPGTAPALPGACRELRLCLPGWAPSAENKAAVLDECLSSAAVCDSSQRLSLRELKIILCMSNLF